MPATRVCPSEYSVQPPSSNASPPRCILSWNSPVVQSTYVRRVARILVRVPTSPLAISSALWFSATNIDRARLKTRFSPLVGFGVPPESFSVVPSRAALPRQGLDRLLSWALAPYNTCRQRGSTGRGPCQARFVPPSGFGYPLDGLRPPKPGRACFIPTAFLGFFPSERSPLTRWPTRFRIARTCVSSVRRDLPQANLRTGAKDTDFQALALARVPGRERVFSPPPAGGSPGILPFQGSPTGRLARTSARNSPLALRLPRP